jgi:cytochrome b subunit of formate dehydrogenase
LAGGRRWHFFFAWIFALNGLLYAIYNIANGHVRKFLFTAKDAVKAPAMVLYYLRIQKQSPQTGEYNPLQKMAYTGVFLLLTPLIMLSGMAMSPQLDTAFHWLPAMFGGRQSARSIHFILTFLFVGFTFGHVFMVLTTGVLNNMRSIVTGWHKEKDAEQTEPVRLQNLKENMIQEPAKGPLSSQLTAPELEEASPTRETEPAHIDTAQPDNGISKSETQSEQIVPESSKPTVPHPPDTKKDNVE